MSGVSRDPGQAVFSRRAWERAPVGEVERLRGMVVTLEQDVAALEADQAAASRLALQWPCECLDDVTAVCRRCEVVALLAAPLSPAFVDWLGEQVAAEVAVLP